MTINTLNKLGRVSSIAAGSDFTIDVPPGPRVLKELRQDWTGTVTKAQIEDLEVVINTSTIQKFKTAEQMELISAFYGLPVVANEVRLPFYRDEYRLHSDAMIYALGLANVSTLQIKGTVNAAATSPGMTAYQATQQIPAPADAPDKAREVIARNSLRLMTKVRHWPLTLVAGDNVFSDLPYGPNAGQLLALHMITASDNITSANLKIDQVDVWQNVSLGRMERFLEAYGRVRQANCYHIDFMYEGRGGQELSLAAVQDVELTITASAGDTVDLYAEYADTF